MIRAVGRLYLLHVNPGAGLALRRPPTSLRPMLNRSKGNAPLCGFSKNMKYDKQHNDLTKESIDVLQCRCDIRD